VGSRLSPALAARTPAKRRPSSAGSESARWPRRILVSSGWVGTIWARTASSSARAWWGLTTLRRSTWPETLGAVHLSARAASTITSGPALLQGIARVLSGDLDGDATLADAVSLGELTGAYEVGAGALAERSLVAMARGDWGQAEDLASQARSTLSQAGIGDSYITPLVSAVQARTFFHRGDVPAANQQLVRAQRARPLLTSVIPHIAVQARIELTRVHIALGDPAGARTLMREIDELLRRRPGLGTLAGEAAELRARLARQRDSDAPGASALTSAELRLLPMLSTHLQMQEIAAEMYLSPHTVRAEGKSLYRKLGAGSRGQAVARARELGLLEG
jgi:LuxR family maltose regulon positive regulatory protein